MAVRLEGLLVTKPKGLNAGESSPSFSSLFEAFAVINVLLFLLVMEWYLGSALLFCTEEEVGRLRRRVGERKEEEAIPCLV